MFKVEIKNLKVKTRIGIKPNERNKPQLLLVTLSFNYSLSKKLDANNIKNLKDYSAITRYLKNFIKKNSYNTLEKLIIECTKSLKKEFKLTNISLKINKTMVARKYGCDSLSVSQ